MRRQDRGARVEPPEAFAACFHEPSRGLASHRGPIREEGRRTTRGHIGSDVRPPSVAATKMTTPISMASKADPCTSTTGSCLPPIWPVYLFLLGRGRGSRYLSILAISVLRDMPKYRAAWL